VDARPRLLLGVLEGAQDIGLLGPGPVGAHIDHSEAWAGALGPSPPSFLDLGSGGGVPGLVLALRWPETRATLLDARARSVAWLADAADRLGLGDRVEVVQARAEVAGRDPELRETFALVVSRGFGAPAVTAECGSAFLAVGGRLSVSEPPGGDPGRWPPERLRDVGLQEIAAPQGKGASFVLLEKVEALGAKWPRREGTPGRRPLW
jgi:16S rRNA (guanine527-N7)-methyltransferase